MQLQLSVKDYKRLKFILSYPDVSRTCYRLADQLADATPVDDAYQVETTFADVHIFRDAVTRLHDKLSATRRKYPDQVSRRIIDKIRRRCRRALEAVAKAEALAGVDSVKKIICFS